MQQERKYITPSSSIEPWLGKECWMMAGDSGWVEPTSAPPRRDPAF